MTPEKADYLNALPRGVHVFDLLKGSKESWDHHRLRLCVEIRGLALTKASYATCLLYPKAAQVACLDTWMLRVLLGTSRFEPLSYARYTELERVVSVYARRHRVPVCLAQWMMWDWARGTTTPQRFFDS